LVDAFQYYEDMAKEFADDVSFKIVARSGHWMPEENPEGFVSMVREFLQDKKFI
jgi:pimeloyl-ACP methyl ester carboxylesterase